MNDRAGSHRLRVLHVHVALYQPYLMVKALRKLGHRADSVVFGDKSLRWLIHDADIILKNRKKIADIANLFRFLMQAIGRYDIFHFHSLPGFIPIGWSRLLDRWVGVDLGALKRAGKKIVFSHWGCHDGRLPSSFSRYENNTVCSECNGYNGLCSDAYVRSKCEPQRRHADLIITHDPDFCDYNQNAFYLNGLIDTDFCHPDEKIPAKYLVSDIPANTMTVLHGFANSGRRGGDQRNIKGTRYVFKAVERLKSEGYPIRMLYFNRIPNRELKYYQLQADIIVDQLFYGWVGSMSREGLALGKPVVTFLRKEWLQNCNDHPPVIQAQPDTIYRVLKKSILDRSHLKALGKKARDYAVKHLDYRVVGRKLETLYNRLWPTPSRG